EFKELARAPQGTRAHLTLESILHVDLHSPAKTSGGMRLAPEMLVNAEGRIVGFGEPGQFGKAMTNGRTIDVALLKKSVLNLNDLVGQKASDLVLAVLDYKTGNAKLSGVRDIESLPQAPYIRLSQGGDIVAATEAKLARMSAASAEVAAAAKPAVTAASPA